MNVKCMIKVQLKNALRDCSLDNSMKSIHEKVMKTKGNRLNQ